MKQFLRRKFINFIARQIFNLVVENDILKVSGNKVIHKGRVLTNDEKKSIIGQAKSMNEMFFWELLLTEMKHIGNQKIYFESKTESDLLAGKMILWVVDVMERKVKNLSNLS